MNYCVSILVLVLTASPLQAGENNQNLEELKTKYNNPVYERLEEVKKENRQLYQQKCILVATEKRLRQELAHHGPEQCVPKIVYNEQLNAANAYRDSNKRLVKKFEDAAQEQAEVAQKVKEQLTALKADHTNGKCVPTECFEQIKQQNKQLQTTLEHAQKETIKTTIVTQPTTNTNQLLLTVGATTLAVSFIMHSRYHAGNFSWVVDKLLPWNYLNLR